MGTGMFKDMFKGISDLALVCFMVGILVVLFTPIPAFLLDLLLLINVSVALLVLLVTFYTEKPLSFSTFPSLLLMTTLFRLALNISSTRLILDQGDAGKVINAIGTYVIGGNYVIGLVVFLILVIVQYVVVTNGAQRVAEVAARFTLDSLPGKQMSVDADLNMGLIDQEQAKKRRSELEKECNFYGAMDGASKFVKGDAIAGIIIVIINIIGGLSIGIVQNNMTWADALHRYTLLTVGDGIVTQIPSLVIATATGIIITRAATDSRLGAEMVRQFSSHPKTMIIVGIALAGLLFLPGLPIWQILMLITILGIFSWLSFKKKLQAQVAEMKEQVEETISALSDSSDESSFYELMKVEPFQLSVGRDMAQYLHSGQSDFEKRIVVLRRQLAKDLGFVLPSLSIKTDAKLGATEYQLMLQGVSIARGDIHVQRLLAIGPTGAQSSFDGIETREPTYGLPALWILPENRQKAKSAGYTIVEAEAVLVTHLQEISKSYAPEFLTRGATEALVENRRAQLGTTVDELIPTVITYSDLQRVLQALLGEQVSITNLQAIMEVLVDCGRTVKAPEDLAERVRERLGASICESLKSRSGELQVLTLDPDLERQLINGAKNKESAFGIVVGIDYEKFVTRLSAETEKMLRANHLPILLCANTIRRPLRSILARTLPQLRLLAIGEIVSNVKVVSFGVVALERTQKEVA